MAVICKTWELTDLEDINSSIYFLPNCFPSYISFYILHIHHSRDVIVYDSDFNPCNSFWLCYNSPCATIVP